jgi:Protein of unknown function (DUF3467)
MSEEAQSSLPTNEESKSEPELTLVNMHVPFPDTFVYSNCSAFSVSQMDIRISFAEAMPNRTAQARVGVVLPPEHAALLAMTLTSQIHIYERAFGPVRLAQWQSQKEEAIKRLLDAGVIHASPEATGPPPDPTVP